MRITNSILQRETLSRLQQGAREMREAHRRATSGLRVEVLSDDPAAGAAAMQTRGALRALTQYRKNIDRAVARLATEEGVVDQVGLALERALELAHAGMGATASGTARAALGSEAEELREHVVQLSNTRFAGEYLFGGEHADAAPFAADGTASTELPPAGGREHEIGPGRLLRSSHDGVEAFVDSGVHAALAALADALADPEGDVAAAATQLRSAHSAIQDLLAETGARTSQLESAAANLEAYQTNLQAHWSDLVEVDLEEAITELVSRQVAYQAALAATSRIFETTLTNYLR